MGLAGGLTSTSSCFIICLPREGSFSPICKKNLTNHKLGELDSSEWYTELYTIIINNCSSHALIWNNETPYWMMTVNYTSRVKGLWNARCERCIKAVPFSSFQYKHSAQSQNVSRLSIFDCANYKCTNFTGCAMCHTKKIFLILLVKTSLSIMEHLALSWSWLSGRLTLSYRYCIILQFDSLKIIPASANIWLDRYTSVSLHSQLAPWERP